MDAVEAKADMEEETESKSTLLLLLCLLTLIRLLHWAVITVVDTAAPIMAMEDGLGVAAGMAVDMVYTAGRMVATIRGTVGTIRAIASPIPAITKVVATSKVTILVTVSSRDTLSRSLSIPIPCEQLKHARVRALSVCV